MAEVDRVRGLFRTAGLARGGSYEVMAVLILRGHEKAPVRTAEIDRLQALYAEMKKHHWWLTGVADLPACAMLVAQDAARPLRSGRRSKPSTRSCTPSASRRATRCRRPPICCTWRRRQTLGHRRPLPRVGRGLSRGQPADLAERVR